MPGVDSGTGVRQVNDRTPFQVFLLQRSNARKASHEFTITFKEWVDLWGERYADRGQFQLQRIDKALGYVPGNLRIGRR